jgi:ethanolamine transporter EutH
VTAQTLTLDQQREQFAQGRFLAMPTAGMIAWAVVGLGGALLPPAWQVWTLWLATGSIFGLGLLVARLTGEDLLGRTRPKNEFDGLFMSSVVGAWLVFAIVVPFVQADYTSLPLTMGILAGLMWMPFSWIIRHWVGYFHAIARTLGLVVAWYLWPDHRFTVLPAIIVAVYAITLVVLARRRRALPTLAYA